MVTKLVTDLRVSPSDWLTNPYSVNSSWQIWYRYKGKLVKVMGMKKEKRHSSRVQGLTKYIELPLYTERMADKHNPEVPYIKLRSIQFGDNEARFDNDTLKEFIYEFKDYLNKRFG